MTCILVFPLCHKNELFTYLQTVLLLAKWIWSAIFLNNSWLISMYHLTSLYFDLLFVNLLSCKMLIRWVPSTTFLKKNHMFISWFNGFHLNQFDIVWNICIRKTWKRSFFSKIGYSDLPNVNGQAMLSTAALVNLKESKVSLKLKIC